MGLYNIIVREELQVVHDIIRRCDVSELDTLSAAKSSMRVIHNSFLADGYEDVSKTVFCGDSFSSFCVKKNNSTYTVQLTKAIL